MPGVKLTGRARLGSVAAFVLCGIVLNIFVAWTLPLLSGMWQEVTEPWIAWPSWTPSSWPRPDNGADSAAFDFRCSTWETRWISSDRSWTAKSRSDRGSSYAANRESLGCPFRALVVEGGRVPRSQWVAAPGLLGGLDVPDLGRMPVVPLLPGFIANTAVYAIGLWAAGRSIRWVTRASVSWIRARRDQCRHCGYSRESLAVNGPCPECGRIPRG